MWNSWTNDFAKQGMHNEFFKYFSTKLLIQMCLKIFIILFSECIDQPMLRNGKYVHAYILSTCNNRDELLGTNLVELFAEYGHFSWAREIILQVQTSS